MTALPEFNTSVAEIRTALIENGYLPIPAIGKRPVVAGWSTLRMTADTVDHYLIAYPTQTNTGLLTGHLVAIDIDAPDDDTADLLVGMVLDLTNGAEAPCRVGRAPKCLFVFRTDEPLPKASTGRYLINGERCEVEVLGDGQQFIAYGIHPETGKPYVWSNGSPIEVPLADLPLITAKTLATFVADCTSALASRGVPEKTLGSAPALMPGTPSTSSGDGIWSDVKDAAFANLDAWVPQLGLVRLKRYKGGWLSVASFRPSNRAGLPDAKRGQALEISPAGICDHSDDSRGYSPIDLVMVCHGLTHVEAAEWLRGKLGIGDAKTYDASRASRLLDKSMAGNATNKLSAASGSRPAAANDNTPQPLNIFDWTSNRFASDPEPVEYLVDGVIESGIPGMLAAMGEVGKSFSILELHRRIAFGSSKFASPILGGKVVQEGTAVFISGEDDDRSMRRRLDAIDPKGERFTSKGEKMIVIPMPSVQGGIKPFWRQDKRGDFIETDEFQRLRDQLAIIKDLRSVAIDPLQLFAAVPVNDDPAAGQFVCGSIATLAAQTKANFWFAHHMKKAGGKDKIETLGDARDAIRGTTALVDGVRVAYGMWYPSQEKAIKICKEIGVAHQSNRIVYGGVVKANGAASRVMSTYARNEFGLLVDVTARLASSAPPQADLMTALVIAIEAAAADRAPFTKTGLSGVFSMRERLPEELRTLSRHRLEGLTQQALEAGQIVTATAKGEKAGKWLDVPTGMFAYGLGEFKVGRT